MSQIAAIQNILKNSVMCCQQRITFHVVGTICLKREVLAVTRASDLSLLTIYGSFIHPCKSTDDSYNYIKG